MQMIVAVALGGATGAVLRYLVSTAVTRTLGSGFPYGTLSVNVAGSLALGVLVVALTSRLDVSAELRGFLTVGLLGGFTTFSTFALEGGSMLERGEMQSAFLYMVGSVVLGISAFFIGTVVARTLLGAGS